MQRVTQSPIAKVPVARILAPFIIGVIASALSDNTIVPAAILAVGIALYIGLRFAPHTPKWSQRLRPLWSVPIMTVSLALGWGNASLCAPPEMDVKTLDGRIAQARVNDIRYSDFSMTVYATMTSVADDNKAQLLDKQHDILLTTRGCNYMLQPGDMISFECSLDTIKSLGNPDGFDYQSYMLDQGIRYREHLASDGIAVWGSKPTFITRCNKYRRQLQQAVFLSTLSPEAQNFVIATLLGNSRFISPETRQEFSAAGISHVLALSGLHVGIIMAIVWFMLFPLDYLGMRRLRFVITIIMLLGYAAFTGLSPSVVRATVMMVVVVTGMIFYRKSVSLNALATAALVILVFSPRALYSVGFQLSFTTVAAFLLFFEKTGEENKKGNTAVRYLKKLVAGSVVAMLSTIMLTAWYFSSVSLTSVIGNIFILPVFPLIMACMAAFLILCAIGINAGFLKSIINLEYDFVRWVARVAGEDLPGHIDGIYVTGFDVAMYYIALVLVLVWYRTRKFKWMNYALVMVFCILAHGAYVKMTVPTRGLVVFNNFTQTQIFTFNNGKGQLWVPDGETDTEEFRRYNKKFIAHYGIDSISENGATERDVVNAKRIVCAVGGKWKSVEPLSSKIETDILVVTKKYHSSIEKLLSIYSPKMIILSGDIYDGNIKEITDECESMGIPYFNIKERGAWMEMK